MATWQEVEAAAPELAAAVRAAFDAHKHRVLATLRADGSPRVSGNEMTFKHSEIWMGMMHRSVKALDSSATPAWQSPGHRGRRPPAAGYRRTERR